MSVEFAEALYFSNDFADNIAGWCRPQIKKVA